MRGPVGGLRVIDKKRRSALSRSQTGPPTCRA